MTRNLHEIVKRLSIMKPIVVLVSGPPGAGKGTQCHNVMEEFNYFHLSAGDLLREERKNPLAEDGKLIEAYIKEGKIVPVKITCKILLNAMTQSGKEKFLIDGFPRNLDNLDGWNTLMVENVDCKFMIYLDCPIDVCRERVLSRAAAGSGRSDDNPETLSKRFHLYEQDTIPIIEYFATLNLVRRIDASKSPQEVYKEIKKLFIIVEETPTK